MSIKKSYKSLLLPWFLLLTFAGSGCVTITDKRFCSPAGDVSNGAICTHFLTDQKEVLTFDQFVEFLDAQENPAKGAAICMSSDDFTKMKSELEQACRYLGKRCTKIKP